MSSSSPSESDGEMSGTVPQVVAGDPAPRPTRRSFTAEYKARIVAEYESAPHGEKSGVLRREGLYHSHIKEWASARDAGALSGLTDSRTSAKRPHKSASPGETARLRAENTRLAAQLAQTRAALDIMGKVSVSSIEEARSGLKMVVRSPADVVALWPREAVEK